jgi:hypothetical protein
MEDFLLDLFLVGLPLWLVGAIVLQVKALRRFEGGWWVAAWIPALAMGAAVAVAVLGTLAGSNLAPIWIVFALPLCLAWLVALWLVRAFAAWLAA